MNPSTIDQALTWLDELADSAGALHRASRPRLYYSQRRGSGPEPRAATPLAEVVRQIVQLVRKMASERLFAEVLGYDCVDSYGDFGSTPLDELESRLGKGRLWEAPPDTWSEDDLCDFIEVFHDVAARSTRESFHSFSGCGWHPLAYSRNSGRTLYRWRINQLLDETEFPLRLADQGEDIGRMVQGSSGELSVLIDDAIKSESEHRSEIHHAVALFRSRGGTREDRRSAIVTLDGILEQRKNLLKGNLTRRDESDLFEIANRFDLRHRNSSQLADYDDNFLEWIFYWYLATVDLSEKLLAERT